MQRAGSLAGQAYENLSRSIPVVLRHRCAVREVPRCHHLRREDWAGAVIQIKSSDPVASFDARHLSRFGLLDPSPDRACPACVTTHGWGARLRSVNVDVLGMKLSYLGGGKREAE